MNTVTVGGMKVIARRRLSDVLPREFIESGEYVESSAYALRDAKVHGESYNPSRYFKHKYLNRPAYFVYHDNSEYLVAWNENPNTGWSFPVKRMRKLCHAS